MPASRLTQRNSVNKQMLHRWSSVAAIEVRERHILLIQIGISVPLSFILRHRAE
jgi:hypothetical protein